MVYNLIQPGQLFDHDNLQKTKNLVPKWPVNEQLVTRQTVP